MSRRKRVPLEGRRFRFAFFCFAGSAFALLSLPTPVVQAQANKLAPPPVVVESVGEPSAPPQDNALKDNAIKDNASYELPPAVKNPLPPSSAPQAGGPSARKPEQNIRPASFLNVTPGVTLRKELASQLGAPVESTPQADGNIYVYRPEGLGKVEVFTGPERVKSVVIHLHQPTAPLDVARELGFEANAFVPVNDDEGAAIGWSLPERAVMFAFGPDTNPPQVTQVVLDEISPEPFVIRALHFGHRRCQRSFSDLEMAEKLGSAEPRLFAARAELLGRLGDTNAALENIADAMRREPGSTPFALTKAWLLGEAGQTKAALQLAHNAISAEGVPDQWKARGECLIGDLMAQNTMADTKAALEHHQLAIQLAKPLAADLRPAVRREARQVLVDAHLGMAADIAAGDFRNKDLAIREWLKKASDCANEYLERDQGPDDLRLSVYCGVLRAYTLARGDQDPSAAAGEAIREGQSLIGDANDPLYQRLIEWQLGLSLMNVARLERNRGKYVEAQRYAQNAAGLATSGAEVRFANASRDFTRAQLHYLVGSIHAIGQNDHAQAVLSYVQSIKLLSNLNLSQAQEKEHGEMLVSMGVSFWETGRRTEAMQVTQNGAKLLQNAVDQGTLESEALVVPYGNLASMHSDLGQPEKAREYDALASRAAPAKPSDDTKQR